MGLLTEVVAAGRAPRARARARRGARALPAGTMLADRRAAIEGLGLPLAEGLALEAQAGPGGVRGRRRAAPRASPPARAAAARAPARSGVQASARRASEESAWPTSSPERPASSAATWSSGCSSARATSTCSCARARTDAPGRADRALGAPARPRSASSRWSATCAEPLLGVDDEQRRRAASGKIDHFFHLAAVYDMTRRRRAQHGAQRRRHRATPSSSPTRSSAGHFHHVSSIAVAGDYKGLFREDMFDEGQKLPSPYHRTKFESERIVREQADVPWRVYRPAIVVGDSQTGEMDKIDGPYYFFKAIQRLRHAAARVGAAGRPRARLHEHRAGRLRRRRDRPHRPRARPRRPGLPPRSTRKSQRVGEVLNSSPSAAPRAADRVMRIDKRLTDALPKGVLSLAAEAAGAASDDPQAAAGRARHPRGGRSSTSRSTAAVRHPRHRARARGLGHRGARRSTTTPTSCGTTGSASSTPTCSRTARFEGAVNGKTVADHRRLVRHRPRRRAEGRRRRRHPAARRAQRGEARGGQARRSRRRAAPPTSTRPTSPTSRRSTALVERVLADHARVDMLVNNAGRSIRRSVALSPTTASTTSSARCSSTTSARSS